MQLYVDKSRPKTETLLKKINELGMKAIFVTVDAAAPGKREADERGRAEMEVVRASPTPFAAEVAMSASTFPKIFRRCSISFLPRITDASASPMALNLRLFLHPHRVAHFPFSGLRSLTLPG